MSEIHDNDLVKQ